MSQPYYVNEAPGIYSAVLHTNQVSTKLVSDLKDTSGWEGARFRRHAKFVLNRQIRAASILSASKLPTSQQLIEDTLSVRVKPFVNQTWQTNLAKHAEIQFVRYIQGEHYVPHTDFGPTTTNRHFTVLCYLNGNFEGGKTYFPKLGIRVVPQAGKVIIFPSTFTHQAETVTAGEKYIWVTWILGSEPVDWI